MDALNFSSSYPILFDTLCSLEATAEAGQASYDTVMSALMTKLSSDESRAGIMQTFKHIDLDKSETLNAGNLKEIAKLAKNEMNDEEAQSIV